MRAAGIDCLVLETGTRASTERRPRAGVIEERAVRGLVRRGPARVLLERAQRHTAFESAGQSCGGRSRSRWSATLSASPTSRRRCPSRSAYTTLRPSLRVLTSPASRSRARC
nr:hypothetical protein [Streptomyces sp. SGAir0924]